MATNVILGILLAVVGVSGFLNVIFLWIPQIVQGHAVTGNGSTKDTVLRVAGALLYTVFVVVGIVIAIKH
jgi:hypothetical protein